MTKFNASTIRKITIAGVAAVAMTATGSIAAPVEAHAGGGKFAAAVVGGVVLGGLLAASARPVYAAPGYGYVYTPQCWTERQFVGHDYYGNPVYNNVQICR